MDSIEDLVDHVEASQIPQAQADQIIAHLQWVKRWAPLVETITFTVRLEDPPEAVLDLAG